MHILHIDLGREMRGGQHQVLLLLKALRVAGHSFTLLTRRASPLFEAANRLKFNVEDVSMMKIRRLSAEHDLVHAHDSRSHTLAALMSRKPFVVSRRVAFPVKTSAFSKWKYGRAARFLAVSEFVAGKLRQAGVTQLKIDVIHDAVEPAQVQGWSQNAPVIALASDDPQKGRDLLERVSRTCGIPIVFSNNLIQDFAHASAFVYISRSEGFGSAALLAMSMGVPVIASRIDGMVEVVEDGVSGLLVENEVLAIAKAIRRIRMNSELAKTVIQNAHHRAEALFSPSTLLMKTLASYRRALAL